MRRQFAPSAFISSRFSSSPRFLKLAGELLVLAHQLFGVAVVDVGDVRVFHVEVVVALLYLSRRDLPCVLVLRALPPPLLFKVKFLYRQGLGAGVRFVSLRIRVLEKPHLLCRPALFDEKNVCFDAGVRAEHAVGEAHDRVQVELFKELALERRFDALPTRNPSGSTTAARPVSGFRRCMMRAMKRSAVSRVWYFRGKLFSIPSSSIPPNGGFVITMSTRSFGP
jgi:hypothetical protein